MTRDLPEQRVNLSPVTQKAKSSNNPAHAPKVLFRRQQPQTNLQQFQEDLNQPSSILSRRAPFKQDSSKTIPSQDDIIRVKKERFDEDTMLPTVLQDRSSSSRGRKNSSTDAVTHIEENGQMDVVNKRKSITQSARCSPAFEFNPDEIDVLVNPEAQPRKSRKSSKSESRKDSSINGYPQPERTEKLHPQDLHNPNQQEAYIQAKYRVTQVMYPVPKPEEPQSNNPFDLPEPPQRPRLAHGQPQSPPQRYVQDKPQYRVSKSSRGLVSQPHIVQDPQDSWAAQYPSQGRRDPQNGDPGNFAYDNGTLHDTMNNLENDLNLDKFLIPDSISSAVDVVRSINIVDIQKKVTEKFQREHSGMTHGDDNTWTAAEEVQHKMQAHNTAIYEKYSSVFDTLSGLENYANTIVGQKKARTGLYRKAGTGLSNACEALSRNAHTVNTRSSRPMIGYNNRNSGREKR